MAKKKVLIALGLLSAIPMPVFAFFCPPRPQRPPYNIIAGNIIKIDKPEQDYPVPLNSVRISVEGTNIFAFTNSEGFFYLSDIEQDKIQLRFEYSDVQVGLDLGEVGLNNRIILNNIMLGNGKVEVGSKETKPFQTLEVTGTE